VSLGSAADGRTLFVGSVGNGSAIYAIDTATFAILHRWSMPAEISGLGLSMDGARQIASVPLPGVESILHVGALGG
jgi:hypothetical protein